MSAIKIAHLSDLHFSTPSFRFGDCFNKRSIGNLNLLFFRKEILHNDHLVLLPGLFDRLGVEQICITGDLSSLSLDREFSMAKTFINTFSQPVHLIPGNHDCYIKSVEKKKKFYDFFPSEPLKTKRVEKRSLGKGWWWIGLDCAYATPPFCAQGYFTSDIETALKETLDAIPEPAHILMNNHFPLYPSPHTLRNLQGAERLQNLLRQHPSVKIYLHGHDHHHYLKESAGLPVVCNSGSTSHHSNRSLYLLTLYPHACFVQQLFYKDVASGWILNEQKMVPYAHTKKQDFIAQ